MKSKVITVTPNPALDITGFVDHITVNEKTYVHDEIRAPGGNAINAARIMHRLGIPVVASGFLGGGAGAEIAAKLAAEGLPQKFIKSKESTRINITISNRKDHNQSRLSFSGPHISRAELIKLAQLVQKTSGAGILVIGGSLPPGFDIRHLEKLINIAQKKKMEVVVDCPGPILRKLKAKNLLLIKPNLEEFNSMIGKNLTTVAAVKKEATKLLKMCSHICISSVEGGALLVTSTGAYFGRIPKVKIRSTVGAGDSMVGSMVAQMHNGNTAPEDILRWGLAASAATLGKTGTSLGDAATIKSLYKKTKVQSV